MLGNFFKHNM